MTSNMYSQRFKGLAAFSFCLKLGKIKFSLYKEQKRESDDYYLLRQHNKWQTRIVQIHSQRPSDHIFARYSLVQPLLKRFLFSNF